jgi:ketosteroid isomerase-like protein
MVVSKCSLFLPLLMILAMGWMMAEYAQEPPAASSDLQLKDLADAERAFAATTVKEGFREGFIKFFADDGIGFSPHPQRTRSELMKSPPATGPRKVIFNWQPVIGDISIAGDLGYTTGPVLFTDITANPKPPWHGMYFSVWQKQADGTWKVAVDMGVDMPQAVAAIDAAFTPVPRANAISQSDAGKLKGPDYLAIDAEFSSEIEKKGMAKAYDLYLSPEFRVHRNGNMPITTKETLDAFFEKDEKKLEYKTIGGKIAASRDLSFTYGSVSESSKLTGYYVHVWRKDKQARWRLVADVLNGLERK